MFGNVRQAFGTILENPRKSSESGRKSSENRQKRDYMFVQFGNNWIQKISLTAKLDSACSSVVQFWLSSEFFSSNYFQIRQRVVLLHIHINVLMTQFLTIFRRFPTTFRRFPKIFQNCSEDLTNVSEQFPNIFRRLPKISEDCRRRPKMFRSYTNKF